MPVQSCPTHHHYKKKASIMLAFPVLGLKALITITLQLIQDPGTSLLVFILIDKAFFVQGIQTPESLLN